MAHAFSRLESLAGGVRVASAMRARPDLVGGPDGADFLLMTGAPGWLAKGGAEGLICAAGPDGTGVALKTEDGAARAHAPALAAFLGRLGVDLPELAARPILNTRGERVGEVAAASLTPNRPSEGALVARGSPNSWRGRGAAICFADRSPTVNEPVATISSRRHTQGHPIVCPEAILALEPSRWQPRMSRATKSGQTRTPLEHHDGR